MFTRIKNMFKRINYISILIVTFTTQLFSQEQFNVDVLPTNVGGKSEFRRMFEQELIYPVSSLKQNIGGVVKVNFIINKDSTVSNPVFSESGAPDINIEAQRLFNKYKWVPAIKDGKYISTLWTSEFEFDPKKYPKICKNRGFVKPKYIPKVSIDSSEKVYTVPDQFPMYPKGNYALQDFIKENLEYPRQAQLSNIQGIVVVRFIVETTGLMTNIGIEKHVGGGCDQEAVRILEMIKWYPGKKDDKLVRVEMTLPIYFVLNKDFKDNSAGEQK